jgi:hypothetical protein
MDFSTAFKALKEGKKIKRKCWQGYWQKTKDVYNKEGKDTIFMHCKDGRVLDIRETQDVMFTIGNIAENDWEVVE